MLLVTGCSAVSVPACNIEEVPIKRCITINYQHDPIVLTSFFSLGCVDKLNPDSDAGKQHEGSEALDQLVVAGGEAA